MAKHEISMRDAVEAAMKDAGYQSVKFIDKTIKVLKKNPANNEDVEAVKVCDIVIYPSRKRNEKHQLVHILDKSGTNFAALEVAKVLKLKFGELQEFGDELVMREVHV